jgi:hypothetical protein
MKQTTISRLKALKKKVPLLLRKSKGVRFSRLPKNISRSKGGGSNRRT